MLIKNVDGKTEPYHVAQGVGQALVAAGVAVEHIPFVPAKFPQTSFVAREGYRYADDVESPVIRYHCASCGLKGEMSGPNCETTQRLNHCNSAEQVPVEVQRKFRVLRIAWERTHKSVKRPNVSAWTENPYGLEITGAQELRKKQS